MRKLKVYSIFKKSINNYVYQPVLAHNTRQAVFKLIQFIKHKKRIVKGVELHIIGEVLFDNNDEIVSINAFAKPKRVHLTKIGKIVSVLDYYFSDIFEKIRRCINA